MYPEKFTKNNDRLNRIDGIMELMTDLGLDALQSLDICGECPGCGKRVFVHVTDPTCEHCGWIAKQEPMDEEEKVMDLDKIEKILEDNEIETCESCGNVFRVELLEEGGDWNDFGFRYCPFCGIETDEYANMK